MWHTVAKADKFERLNNLRVQTFLPKIGFHMPADTSFQIFLSNYMKILDMKSAMYLQIKINYIQTKLKSTFGRGRHRRLIFSQFFYSYFKSCIFVGCDIFYFVWTWLCFGSGRPLITNFSTGDGRKFLLDSVPLPTDQFALTLLTSDVPLNHGFAVYWYRICLLFALRRFVVSVCISNICVFRSIIPSQDWQFLGVVSVSCPTAFFQVVIGSFSAVVVQFKLFFDTTSGPMDIASGCWGCRGYSPCTTGHTTRSFSRKWRRKSSYLFIILLEDRWIICSVVYPFFIRIFLKICLNLMLNYLNVLWELMPWPLHRCIKITINCPCNILFVGWSMIPIVWIVYLQLFKLKVYRIFATILDPWVLHLPVFYN